MKIAVINLKNIIKYIFIFFIIIILVIIVRLNSKKTIQKNQNNLSLINLLKYELPIANSFNKKDDNLQTSNIGIKILSMQIGIFNNVIQIEDNKPIDNEQIEEFDQIEDIIEEEKIIDEDVPIFENETIKKETEIISEHNITPTFTNEYNGIKINNQTSYDISELLQTASYNFHNKKIIIYHTHTCESYTPTEANNYHMTDSYRTTDLNLNVVRVGEELKKELQKYNFDVIHNNTYHDYPSYNGSYGRSLTTLQGIFKDNSDTQVIIDLHRDAIGSDSNYAPRVKIDEELCAQVMFVIGTDGSGLNHPKWRENLQYAIEVQKKANELYPGLFRPIILRNARYNQQLSTGSSIIEVGATGNTLEECIASMKYIAEIFNILFSTKF